jgi:hypothetical protein
MMASIAAYGALAVICTVGAGLADAAGPVAGAFACMAATVAGIPAALAVQRREVKRHERLCDALIQRASR